MADSKYIHPVTDENFDSLVLKSSHQAPVLVDFWAAWCGPCQMLMPLLDRLVEAYAGKFTLAKVNTDEQPQLAARYGIRSLPTVMVFRYGEVVDEFMGVQSEGVIRQIVDRHLEKPSDKLRAQARDALGRNQTAQAVELLQQASDLEPDNDSIKLELANVQLLAGALEPARQILAELSPVARQSDAAKKLGARLQFANAMVAAPEVNNLIRQVETSPNDLKARYQLAAYRLLVGEFEAGLEQLLEIMKRDRRFEDDLVKKGLLAAFEIIDDPELVNRYRQRMTALLF